MLDTGEMSRNLGSSRISQS
jgi:hypothetical protein